MDFLKSISEIKREPLDLKEALERIAAYDKERDKYGYEAKTILRKNEYDFLNIKHVRLEEVFPSLLGFDYDKYYFLRNISKIQENYDSIVQSAEKDIREIPKELPEYAKKELREMYEKTITEYKRQGSLYTSGGSSLCNMIGHLLELFRRAYISCDVAICGDWIDLDTIVDTKVFFEWAQRNGFYIPEEVSCFFGDPVATTLPATDAAEVFHDQQVDGYNRPWPKDTPKDYIDRLRDKKVHADEIQYRTYEYQLRKWDLTQWQVFCLVHDIDYPPEGTRGDTDRDKYGKAYGRSAKRHLARVETSEKSVKMPE